MGKKNKHSKDKLHKTVSELRSHHVNSSRELELSTLHRRLRFDSCCLSLDTITEGFVGLCDEDKLNSLKEEYTHCWVFQRKALVTFLEKYQLHPITGKPISVKSLVELKFHKNKDDKYHCPIIYKLFNQNSKIVANKKSGHVYSYEAYQQLNLKPNSFKDLLTDEAFDKKDIVIIQDPETASERWNVSSFYYVKNKLKLDNEEQTSNIRNVKDSAPLKASLNEYKERADSIAETFNKIVGQDAKVIENLKLDKLNSANHSDGVLSRSVTSTVMPMAREQRAALLTDEQVLYPRIKKKGYIQLITNFGSLNLELFCDKVPKTCHNFLLLASRGYYDNTIFHRLIKNFILQGGDPTGTGSGGQSAWGTPFEDECKGDLKHTGRGIIAMANSGLNSNKSQFYIVLRGAWDHLDGKHTVFGRMVGGDETLEKIEEVEVDKNDKPLKEIKILRTVKYVDPFEETTKMIEEERKKLLEQEKSDKNETASRPQQPLKKFRSGVGAYIDFKSLKKNKSSLG